ncbi:MAG: hypothetical protein IJW31_02950 [Lentisphaeria bacterium]|nr:hypothetical protein [Lentisphaeria bacterium]
MKRLFLLLGIICSFAVWGESYSIEDEKLALSIAFDNEIDPYMQGKNTPSEFITNRFYNLKNARWTVRSKERHGMSYEQAVKQLADFIREWEKGKNWQCKIEHRQIPFMSIVPILDGKINSIEWSNALKFGQVYKIGSAKSLDSKEKSCFFIACDDQNFYIAAEFIDNSIHSYSDRGFINAPKPLYMGDALEFFIRPDVNKPYYCEILVNPQALVWGLRHKINPVGSWDMLESCTEHEIEAKTSIANNVITFEVKVPFKFISKYTKLKDFSFMLIRTNRSNSSYFGASAVPLLYDAHNIFGYIRGSIDKK